MKPRRVVVYVSIDFRSSSAREKIREAVQQALLDRGFTGVKVTVTEPDSIQPPQHERTDLR